MRSKQWTASSFLPERTYRSPSIFKVVRSSASLSTICRYSLIAELIFPWERNFSAAFRTLAFSKAIRNSYRVSTIVGGVNRSSGQRDNAIPVKRALLLDLATPAKQPRDTLSCVNKGCQRNYFCKISMVIDGQNSRGKLGRQ